MRRLVARTPSSRQHENVTDCTGTNTPVFCIIVIIGRRHIRTDTRTTQHHINDKIFLYLPGMVSHHPDSPELVSHPDPTGYQDTGILL